MNDMDYYQEKRRQHLEDGFCVIENVLPPELLQEMRELTNRLIDAVPESDNEKQRATGSLIPVGRNPEFAKLATLQPALDAYRRMSFDDVRFTSGYVISKPPHSPPLFWHFDWMGWAHPRSYETEPVQTFFMYYLVDTNRSNGCLRVIPGSHLRDHPLHDQLEDAHTPAVVRAENLEMAEFTTQPDEVDVPVKAGDLVIGDSRLLHAAHANSTDARRTVITLWMFPNFGQLPPPLQAFVVAVRGRNPQWADVNPALAAMRPDCPPGIEATPASRTRFRQEDR